MQGDREHAELINDVTNRSLEALSRIRPPSLGQSHTGTAQPQPATEVKVNISEGANYQKLYTNYSKGIEAASPVNKTLEVARNAARDGQPVEAIANILRNDPKAQQFGDKSEQFIQTVAKSAVRKTQAERSTEQVAQHRQKTPTVER